MNFYFYFEDFKIIMIINYDVGLQLGNQSKIIWDFIYY